MKRVLVRGVLIALAALAFLYIVDYVVLRVRPNPHDQVMVDTIYALHKTKNLTNYMPGNSASQECVKSIFPHMDEQPCWWLRRHTEKQVEMY